jgi:hypothetical protein
LVARLAAVPAGTGAMRHALIAFYDALDHG